MLGAGRGKSSEAGKSSGPVVKYGAVIVTGQQPSLHTRPMPINFIKNVHDITYTESPPLLQSDDSQGGEKAEVGVSHHSSPSRDSSTGEESGDAQQHGGDGTGSGSAQLATAIQRGGRSSVIPYGALRQLRIRALQFNILLPPTLRDTASPRTPSRSTLCSTPPLT